MSLLGVLANTLTVLLGGSLGLFCRRGLPEKVTNGVMIGIGLCTLYLGISGSLACENPLLMIIAVALGAVLGFALDLDRGINRLGRWVESKFAKRTGAKTSVAEGFVSASLLFCVGAMTVVGSLEAGLRGDNTTLYTLSLIHI